jgi:hypothetical protein
MPITGVILNTEDRFDINQDPGDCQVTPRFTNSVADRPFPGGFVTVLNQILLPRGFVGIDSTSNTIQMIDNALTVYSVNIPEGDYSGATFASWFQAQLIADVVFGTALWTVTFDSSTYKLTVQNTAPVTWRWVLGSGSTMSAHEVLGIPREVTRAFANALAASQTSPYRVRSLHINLVYVVVDWPGIHTVGTVTSYDAIGNASAQTGTRPILAIGHPPAEYGNPVEFSFINKPYWHSEKFPTGPVRMQLFDHQWNPITMLGEEWAVHLSIYEMPGTSNWLNHVTIAEESRDLRKPPLPDRDTTATAGDALPPESRASLVRGRKYMELPGPGNRGTTTYKRQKRFANYNVANKLQ